MTINICVIGNSHVGALKLAWEEMKASFPEYSLTFFAIGSNGMDALKADMDNLVTNSERLKKALIYTSGGLDFIKPKNYQIFLLYGMNASPSFLFNNNYYSQDVTAQALKDLVYSRLSFSVIKEFRKVSNEKIYIGHNPLKASDKNETVNKQNYYRGISALNETIYSKLDCELLPQPDETLYSGSATKLSFAKGSVKLVVSSLQKLEHHEITDISHMNSDFGRLWLLNFFEEIS